MTANSVEWIQARDLLLSLAQALAPIAGENSSLFKAGSALSLHQRLFIPRLGPPGSESSFRHPVRLLTALHSAQKGIEELLDKLPAEGGSKTISNPSEKQSTEKPIFEKKESSFEERKKEASSKTASEGEKIWMGKKPNQPPTVANQAQKLVDQVRVAIRTLSNSYVFSNPHEAPLKDVFERLKPLVEEMIAAVGRGDMPSSDSGSASAFRLPLPLSPREHLLKKQIPFPKAESSASSKEAVESHTWIPQREPKQETEGQPLAKLEPKEKPPLESLRRESLRLERELRRFEAPASEREVVRKTPQVKNGPEAEQPAGRPPVLPPQKLPSALGAFSAIVSNEPEPRPPIAERTVLPSVPFFPGQIPLSSSEKKKKKKRGLWEPKEREDSER